MRVCPFYLLGGKLVTIFLDTDNIAEVDGDWLEALGLHPPAAYQRVGDRPVTQISEFEEFSRKILN